MTITLIITTYNWPSALKLVLTSALRQSTKAHEIIIADDGSDFKTKELINNFIKQSSTKIIHSWQKDKGFRAAKSRNKAIAIATGEYIILIDGDMILEKNFIHDHMLNIANGCFIQGRRVLLTKDKSTAVLANNIIDFSFFTSGVQNKKNSLRSKWLTKIFDRKNNNINGIISCNMSFFRQDCIHINGFNEDFIGWGREDSEFAQRLINNNILRKNIRFCAVAYHLFHKQNSKGKLTSNDKILHNTIKEKLTFCENGINKYL